MASLDVDYSRTSDRIRWGQVPPEAAAALGDRLGSVVVEASSPVGSGFGGHFAGTLVLQDGRKVFVKATPEELDFPATALRQEAAVLTALPDGAPHARFVALVERSGWVLLALQHVEGRMPGRPWSEADLESAHRACVAAGAEPPPPGIDVIGLEEGVRDDEVVATERALAAGAFRLPRTYGTDRWLEAVTCRHGDELAALSRSAASWVDGNHLCHNDLRPDNLIVTDHRTVIVDWNLVSRGPRWADFACLLPMAHAQGLDVSRWWHAGLLADARAEQIDALLAVVGVYMLSRLAHPAPPGCTVALKHHQLAYAHDFARLLADRRGWPAR